MVLSYLFFRIFVLYFGKASTLGRSEVKLCFTQEILETRNWTCLQLLWQTMKTQMKCHILRYIISVCTVCGCTVCKDKLDLRNKYIIFFEIITYDPSMYRKNHPDFIVYRFMENSIGLIRIKK